MNGNVPVMFGRYRVKKHLGSGAFGHTYLVELDGQEAAVKWLKPDSETNGDKRFANEQWALQHLNHPSIPRLIDTGELDGRPYLIMTFARGQTLQKVYKRQVEEGGAISQIKMLAITEAVLDALSHMHGRGICHRDVKPDNIVATESVSNVTLIDLGVCKGKGQPLDAATFWNAGASRFSPPDKLKYPTAVHPTHDVFAVGVVGYLLLTNNFPWSVGASEDRGDLEDQMRRNPHPIPIHQQNAFIAKQVSEYFASLICIDDDRRPDAQAALRKLREVKESLRVESLKGAHTIPAAKLTAGIKYPRVVRDPIHGDVVMTEFEWLILKTPGFQRLRWIRQLGTSHLVYPGAEHSRFSHAIGTLYVASKIMHRMEERTGERFEPEEFLMARAYALVHDVLHIPYGHALEDEMRIFERHDRNAARISRLIMSDRSKLGELLRLRAYPKTPMDVIWW